MRFSVRRCAGMAVAALLGTQTMVAEAIVMDVNDRRMCISTLKVTIRGWEMGMGKQS